MEGVFTRIIVIQDYLDGLVGLQDEGICLCAVGDWRCGVRTCAEDGVERGDEGGDVGLVVEEGAEKGNELAQRIAVERAIARWHGGGLGKGKRRREDTRTRTY
jgi:hypothetical protein